MIVAGGGQPRGALPYKREGGRRKEEDEGERENDKRPYVIVLKNKLQQQLSATLRYKLDNTASSEIRYEYIR